MVVDSNILIHYINGDAVVIDTIRDWKANNRVLFISSISFAEVLSYPVLSEKDIDEAKNFLAGFLSVPLDDRLAEIAASFRRIHKLKITDAAIAATAFAYKVPLVTRDKQFKKAREIAVVEI